MTIHLHLPTIGLIFADATLLYGGIITAVYLRLGFAEGYYELVADGGFYKAVLPIVFCLGAFYCYGLYDPVIMRNFRELVLRLIQALGLAWVALALTLSALPQLMLGRGIMLIALPLALALMTAWREAIWSLQSLKESKRRRTLWP